MIIVFKYLKFITQIVYYYLRHELALQALQQDGQDVEGDSQDASDKAQADLVEENNLADLVLQQTDQSTAINQNDSLAQASIQDALNTASLDHQFQQTLNHQVVHKQTVCFFIYGCHCLAMFKFQFI
jgi:hypothetical protein